MKLRKLVIEMGPEPEKKEIGDSASTPKEFSVGEKSCFVRKAYICRHCEAVYADGPVTQCDCLEGSGADFIEGEIRYVR